MQVRERERERAREPLSRGRSLTRVATLGPPSYSATPCPPRHLHKDLRPLSIVLCMTSPHRPAKKNFLLLFLSLPPAPLNLSYTHTQKAFSNLNLFVTCATCATFSQLATCAAIKTCLASRGTHKVCPKPEPDEEAASRHRHRHTGTGIDSHSDSVLLCLSVERGG